MYRVYCGASLMYDTTIDDKKNVLFDAKLDLELNKAGSFDFIIHPSHTLDHLLYPLKSIITVYQNNYMIFRGRVLNVISGLYNEKQVLCEGELAFLCDSIQTPFRRVASTESIEYAFAKMIERHNELVDEDKQFKVGIVDVEYSGKASSDNMIEVDYSSTWDAMNKQLIDVFGGYLLVRHEEDGNYIDYVGEITDYNPQSVKLGKNLLSIKREIKGEDIATALIPLGKDDIDITSVNDGFNYIYDEEAVEQYGWIFRVEKWSDITSEETLLATAQKRLKELSDSSSSIEINAADLSGSDEDYLPFRLATNITVESSPHGLNEQFLIKRLQITLAKPSANKLTISKTIKSFTQMVSSQQSTSGDISKAYTYTDTVVNALASEVDEKLDSAILVDESGVVQSTAGTITFDSGKLKINSTNFTLTEDGTISAKAGTIGSWVIGWDSGVSECVIRSNTSVYGTLNYTTTGTDYKSVTGYIFTVLRSAGMFYMVKNTNDYSSDTLATVPSFYGKSTASEGGSEQV